MDKGGAAVAGVALLKGAARTEVTVANCKDGFFVVQIRNIKVVFGEGPQIGILCFLFQSNSL